MNLQIIILAAGQGKRMYSATPKVLHQVAGQPMLSRVIDTAKSLSPSNIFVIYGHEGEQIQQALSHTPVQWVEQAEQLGTGHAVHQALPYLTPDTPTLILYADVPLIQPQTLQALIEQSIQQRSLALLVAELDNPTGLGRIVRNEHDEINTIVEEKDANMQEKQIKEIYTGICCVNSTDLQQWLPQLNNDNAQGEYYLTDIIALATHSDTKISALTVMDYTEVLGVNNRLQLQQVERIWQQRAAARFLEQGVMIADATRFDLRGELHCGKDVFIDINCVFSGTVILGDNCNIGPNCTLHNVKLESGCNIYANSVLEGADLGQECHVGPFARLRTGTQLAAHCKIGNFVETKKAQFGEGSKANHLSYVGDALIGKKVNIGAGTITCNYDGANKHQTIIEDGAFIGSGTELVAPVTVGAQATIGAGSTIRRDAQAGELTLSDVKQKTFTGWKRPVKKD